MYREINSATFFTQTIGRILRMPEPNSKEEYKNSNLLRTGYLFTNYRRNEVSVPDQSNKNKPFVYTSKKRENVSNIEIFK
jgi:type III restriction enzyme